MLTKIQKKILDTGARNLWLEDLAEAFFAEAQKHCPSDRGNLKASAYFIVGEKNITISYPVPYAYTLHEGGVKGDIIGGVNPKDFPWVSKTRGHWRRLSAGKTTADYYNSTLWVNKHEKTYDPYYKPTLLAEGWVTINYQLKSNRIGRKWVQKAWEKVRNTQPMKIKMRLPKNLTVLETTHNLNQGG